MIKRLRIKFILINMVIVTMILAIIFGMLYQSIKIQLDSSSMQMLEEIARVHKPIGIPNQLDKAPHDVAESDGQMLPTDGPEQTLRSDSKERFHLPNFSMTINDNGEIQEIHGEYKDDYSDAELTAIVEEIIARDSDTGILKDYNLRYLCVNSTNQLVIAVVDITTERNVLSKLVKALGGIGAMAFLVFFSISLFLSKWAIKPVERAWQQQKQFVADASHELKTPLTVIMTDAELLQATDCSESDRTQLSAGIMAMAGQMRGLIESMLELARMDSSQAMTSKISVGNEQETVSLSEVANNSAIVFEPIFFDKEMSFSYIIESNIVVTGDSSQLKQVVEILLDNASKYASPNGLVVLKLERTQAKKCLLSVRNEGEPISDEELDNLFKRFYRADKARKMNHSYGLGLSIAQSIADAHRGKIWAESKDGFNRFFVEFPTKQK